MHLITDPKAVALQGDYRVVRVNRGRRPATYKLQQFVQSQQDSRRLCWQQVYVWYHREPRSIGWFGIGERPGKITHITPHYVTKDNYTEVLTFGQSFADLLVKDWKEITDNEITLYVPTAD